MRKAIIITAVFVFGGCEPTAEQSTVASTAPTGDAVITWASAVGDRAESQGIRYLSRRLHPNGVVAERGAYVAGQKEGIWLAWYPSGAILSRTYWSHGVREGEWVFYHPEQDQRSAKFQFKGGRLDGEFLTWNRDGSLASRTSFDRELVQ